MEATPRVVHAVAMSSYPSKLFKNGRVISCDVSSSLGTFFEGYKIPLVHRFESEIFSSVDREEKAKLLTTRSCER